MTGPRHPQPLVARVVLGLAALACAAAIASGQPPSSGRFVLAQSTVSSAGASSSSSSFVLDGSFAQPTTIGEARSTSFLLQSGFWTSLSSLLVLRVDGVGTGAGDIVAPGIDCRLDAGIVSGDCLARINHGSTIELIATAAPGSRFDGWTGCDINAMESGDGNTCQAIVTTGRTVTAGFALLDGSIGGRIWRDLDGNGMQDDGEPGIDGVMVTLDSRDGFSISTTTAAGGHYLFVPLPPGNYTVTVDPDTLPPGLVPTYDLDGVGTPHTAELTVAPGEQRFDADHGYQPLIDLAITKNGSADPLPGGDNLIYAITVENLGPATATAVVVTDILPAETRLVATSGCAEDPKGTPACTLGELGAGEVAHYTIEVSIQPEPPASIINTATVAALEVDVDPSNNVASASTALDAIAPTVVRVEIDLADDDGVLSECQTVHGRPLRALRVRFSEPMLNRGGGTNAGDVTNPASWLLVAAGTDAEFATFDCGPPASDDTALMLGSIDYDTITHTATLALPAGARLEPSLYRLFACGTGTSVLTDLAGNPLDGNTSGSAGGDFVRSFRADPDNLLADGHFDCDLGAWVPLSADPNEISYSADDVDGSADSGSAAVENLTESTELAIGQCQPASAGKDYALSAQVRLETAAPEIGLRLWCEFFPDMDCGGDGLGVPMVATVLLGDTGGDWIEVAERIRSPAEASSTLCAVDLLAPGGHHFDARLDQLQLIDVGDALFADGFE